jgi:hypothetical protein
VTDDDTRDAEFIVSDSNPGIQEVSTGLSGFDISLQGLETRFSRTGRLVTFRIRSNMGSCPPSIVAWAPTAELDQLKSWFYDPQESLVPGEPSIDLRQRAIQRVCPLNRLTAGPSISNARNPNTSRDSLYNSFDTSSPSSVDAVSCIPHKYDTRVDPLRQYSP